MLDFVVQRCTRRCHATDRELKPGEAFYSVLVAKDGDVVRHDYCEEGWQGPPEEALGWWQSQMPSPTAQKMHWAPNDVMLHYFNQLADDPAEADTRYVLALLMIRRRILRLEGSEADESGREVLVLYCPRSENETRVTAAPPSSERVQQIQESLAKLLFADAA